MTKVQSNKREIILSILVSLVVVCILLSPERYLHTTADGITLWAVSVLPGLLPFMFFTDILTSVGLPKLIGDRLGKIFAKIYRVSGNIAYVYIISVLCGYPVGAQATYNLYRRGDISLNDAKTICAIGSTSGPIFVIGTVGTMMLGKASIGVQIYLCHIFAALINGLLYRGKSASNPSNIPQLEPRWQENSEDTILTHAVNTTTRGVLNTGIMVAVFYLVADVLRGTGILGLITGLFSNSAYVEGIVVGILEMTTGCITLSGINAWYVVPTVGAIVSLGGVCIGMQNISYLEKCGVTTSHYLLTKLSHSAITCLLLIILQLNA